MVHYCFNEIPDRLVKVKSPPIHKHFNNFVYVIQVFESYCVKVAHISHFKRCYREMGPKKFLRWILHFSESWHTVYCMVQYNYNGKMTTFRKMRNSPQKTFLAPFFDGMRLKWHMWATFTKKQKILSPSL